MTILMTSPAIESEAMGDAAVTARKRGPKSTLGADPRKRIHDAALACFESRGIKATSMDDVATALGVSRPTVYYYFANKDDLVLEVVARQVKNVLDATRRRLRGKGLDRIGNAAYLTVVESRANPYVRLLVEGDFSQLVPLFLESERVLELLREFWTPLLTEGQERYGLRSDRPLDEMIEWIMFTQFSLVSSGSGFGFSDEDIRERINTYLVPALRA
ncbi:MAG TPA: TetR/AcrR family transcriptional regulator [Sporichthya sp.]|nr:TetR/AcrR family transcriptional regulator [Sporichthya sp.]